MCIRDRPNKDQLIHWDIEDPVARLNSTNDINRKKYILETTYKIIFKKINELLNEK